MPNQTNRFAAIVAAAALVAGACSSSSTDAGSQPTATATEQGAPAGVTAGVARSFPPAPVVPDGPLDPADRAILETMIGTIDIGVSGDVAALADNGDPRVLWILADFLRFTQGSAIGRVIGETAGEIAGVDFDLTRPWGDLTDHLIAWDTPAPPDYDVFKSAVFTTVDPRWTFIFNDAEADIDYRILSWGGVFIDDRPLGDTEPCPFGCIPSLDDPALTPASEGDWYPDDAIVFGVRIGDEAVAFPRNIMEIHEMVNMTIGGRRVAIPYCTLCGAAQVFFTDDVPGAERPPVLRTSGLLSRSNKVMYDLDTQSVFDTFAGIAITGPLRERGVVLEQASVTTTTWADWRATHPDTLIVAEDGGIGRTYALDPLQGRDDNGPIFPIGEVDPRLGVHEQILGIQTPDGTFVAFPVDAARATLEAGDPVELVGVSVELDGQGVRATFEGEPIASHQAFWFAWSQFNPDTELWLP